MRDKCVVVSCSSITSTILAPSLVMVSLTVRLDHCATVKWHGCNTYLYMHNPHTIHTLRSSQRLSQLMPMP